LEADAEIGPTVATIDRCAAESLRIGAEAARIDTGNGDTPGTPAMPNDTVFELPASTP
jgi:hypothetical protein